jgi:hypothetical protein
VAPSLDLKRKHRSDFLRCLYDLAYGSERGLVYIEEIAEILHIDDMEAETAARHLAEKGLIIIRLQRIVSLTEVGIDEVESAGAQRDHPVHAAPTPTVAPPPVNSQLPGLSDAVGHKQLRPMPARIVPNDSEEQAALELKRICAAIGLDPKEITGELAEHQDLSGMEARQPEVIGSVPRNGLVQHEVGREPDVRSQPSQSFEERDLDAMLESLKLRLPNLGLVWDDMAEARAEIDTARTQLSSPRPKMKIIAISLETLLSILENAGAAASASNVRASLPVIRDFCERLRA